jgi:hypothetical protein
MTTKIGLVENKKPKYKLFIELKFNNISVSNILCEIYLPERTNGPVELWCYLKPDQAAIIAYPFEFSIEGEIKDNDGCSGILIKAKKVYRKSELTRSWGSGIRETLLIGVPWDLEIKELLSIDNQTINSEIENGFFWLTPSVMLTPDKPIRKEYTGAISVETIREKVFTLSNGIQLNFDTHFKYKKNEEGDTVTFTELVAGFEKKAFKSLDIKNILTYLNDFLLLVSLAERRSCVCVGWDITNYQYRIKYFKRDIFIPKGNKKHIHHIEMLINVNDFKNYIDKVYKNYINIDGKELIRQAIYKLINLEKEIIESSFISLYSAIENIILFYRKSNNLEYVIVNSDWIKLRKEIKKIIKEYLKDNLNIHDNEKRKLFYEKLNELNRVSFSTVFNKMCEEYSIDLEDLWPLVKIAGGVSLSDIRHKLVHGDIFDPSQYRALLAATKHLQWILERLILSILKWPIEKSNVCKEIISSWPAYHEWQNDRKSFASRSQVVLGNAILLKAPL